MDVLHGQLETIESPGFWNLHFRVELRRKVLGHQAVRRSKEGEDVLEEMALAVRKGLPVTRILRQIDLLSSPERSLMLLVQLPKRRVVDRKHDPSPLVRK